MTNCQIDQKILSRTIKNININNMNSNIYINVNANNGMNISNNQNAKNNEAFSKQNNRAMIYEKYLGKNNKSKEKIITIDDIKNNKSPIYGEKRKDYLIKIIK